MATTRTIIYFFSLILFLLKPWLIFVREHGNSRANIRCVGGGEIITDIKRVIYLNIQKSFTGSYECSLPESDARASFSSSSFFLGGGLLMSFHGHSCPSIMIICIQPQTWGASGRGNGASHLLFFFWSNWDGAPPGSWCPTQTEYSAYRERRYWEQAYDQCWG